MIPTNKTSEPTSPSQISATIQKKLAVEVRVIEDRAQLERLIPEWQDLASRAIEGNVFYEPWMLLPSLASGQNAENLRFVLIYVCEPHTNQGEPVLCGFFPLVERRSLKPIPARTLIFWRSIYCALCVPLLDRGHARAVVAAFFDWMSEKCNRVDVIEMSHFAGDGPVHELFAELLTQRKLEKLIVEWHARAFLRRGESAEQYCANALSAKGRRDYRRQERRLAAHGPVQYVSSQSGTEMEVWIERFLQLEARGWKGQAGTAFANNEQHANFFRAAMLEGSRLGRVRVWALQVGDRTVAIQFNLLAGAGGFAFKTTFAEEYGRYSPGVLLQLHGIHDFHESPELNWMDSCAAPNHPMIDHLWRERRMIGRLMISSGSPMGDFSVAAFPVLRWAKRLATTLMRRRRKSTDEPGTLQN